TVAPADFDLEPLGERVHDAHANAVQTAGHLVRALVELAARVEHRHRDLDARPPLGRVPVDRDAAAVVPHGDGVVRVDHDVDARTMAGERLVHGVVHDLVHQVVQAARTRGADVHAGPAPDRLQALEDLDLACAVLVPLRLLSCHITFVGEWRGSDSVYYPGNGLRLPAGSCPNAFARADLLGLSGLPSRNESARVGRAAGRR